ncbi:protein kinase [Spongiactinospora sp. 9N601]|uniref:protein kinase domain-containing protein n=1 Tax=Spongiactinospora sp. 9N601 TaxID=3375149 RepID=UPI003797AB29
MVSGYEEVRQLGSGGAGRVVLATYTATGAYVAIRYLRPLLWADPAFLARFREEARHLVELDDPHVVRMHEYVETRTSAALVTELVDGVSLRAILDEHRTMSPEAALSLVNGCLAGLATTHDLGIAHRSFKPENVLVQADGTVKIADFGLTPPRGAPPYPLPDGLAAGEAAADLHALTCTLVECLTGGPPQDETLRKVPGSVREAVTAGLSADPEQRPASAVGYAMALDTAARAAYGPEWDKRGRRHLAELATTLALRFPLAGPLPRAAGSHAATDRRRPSRIALFLGELTRPAPQPHDDGSDTIASPHPRDDRPAHGSHAATGRRPSRTARLFGRLTGAAPHPRDGGPPHDSHAPGDRRRDDGPHASPRGGAGGRRRMRRVPQVPGARPRLVIAAAMAAAAVTVILLAADGTPDTFLATPPREPRGQSPERPPGEEPRAMATPTAGQGERSPQAVRTPARNEPRPVVASGTPAAAHTVRELRIAAFDGGRGTLSLSASTRGSVTVAAMFAEGPAPDRLTTAPPRTFTLAGASAYTRVLTHPFAPPACDTTVYRRLTVTAVPGGGTASRTTAVRGQACPPPAVREAQVVAWDGSAGSLRVTTNGPGPVRLTVAYTRRDGEDAARTLHTDRRILRGRTEYTVEIKNPPGDVPCGERAHLGVLVSTDRAATGGPEVREALLTGPPCAGEPTPTDQRPVDEPPGDDESSAKAVAPPAGRR